MRISFSIKEIRSKSADVFKQKEHQKITKDFCSVLTVPNPLCPRSELNNYTLRWLGEGISENQELPVCGSCHTESVSKQTALTSELPKGFKVGSFQQHSARGYGCDGACCLNHLYRWPWRTPHGQQVHPDWRTTKTEDDAKYFYLLYIFSSVLLSSCFFSVQGSECVRWREQTVESLILPQTYLLLIPSFALVAPSCPSHSLTLLRLIHLAFF